jgi:hypothetical protein
MNVTGDFGSYYTGGPPDLGVGQSANRTVSVVVPSDETLGPHKVNFFVSWDYQNTMGQWNYGSNFWKNSTLTVVSRPSPNLPPGTLNRLPSPGWLLGMMAGVMSYGWLIIAPYAVLVSLGSIVVVKRDMKKREALRNGSR